MVIIIIVSISKKKSLDISQEMDEGFNKSGKKNFLLMNSNDDIFVFYIYLS